MVNEIVDEKFIETVHQKTGRTEKQRQGKTSSPGNVQGKDGQEKYKQTEKKKIEKKAQVI